MFDHHAVHRYSEFPLPSEKYIPGQGMHRRDKSNRAIPDCMITIWENDWRTCEKYLYAIDLFNFGYWWEAHEVLEGLWMQAGRKTEQALFIQGIIQIAAALLKDSMKQKRGALSLFNKGLHKIKRQKGVYLGIDAKKFSADCRRFFSDYKKSPPRIVLWY